MMRARHLWVALFCLMVCTVVVLADTLKLKDGTILEGKVIPQGDSYWIKLKDGGTRIVPKVQVASFTPGDAKPITPTTPTNPKGPAAQQTPVAPGGTSQAYASVLSKVNRVETALQAVTLLEKFIETEPNAADLAAAKAELATWTQRQKDNAEKIKGKWIGGEDRKKLKKDVEKLVEDGYKELQQGQTISGIKKLEDALTLYPQSFEANFELGLYYLNRGAVGSDGRGNPAYVAKAIKSLETAVKIAPTSAASWSNLAIGYNVQRRYQNSVEVAYKGAKIRESKMTVTNLVNALMRAPGGMREQAKIKPIMEDAIVMAQRHGVALQASGWLYVRPSEETEGGNPEQQGPPGAAWSGSGFFVTEDGYIITNHHVATGDTKSPARKDITFRVRMDDGTEKNAELIAVYDAADIAVMKINSDEPVPFLKILADNPGQGAKTLCLGYPSTGESPSLQVAEGTVKSTNTDGEFNVWFDLNTTHGNSGGPIVDRDNRVVAIVTAYSRSHNMQIFYGVGPLQIKKFLETLGEKAPAVTWDDQHATEPFDGEKMTEVVRKSTVFILAVKTGESNDEEKPEGVSPEAN